MFSAVIFDLGHTLYDFDADYERTIQRSYIALCSSLRKIVPGFQSDRKLQARFHEFKMKQYIQRDIDLIEVPMETILQNFLKTEGYQIDDINLRPALDAKYGVTEEHWVLAENARPVLEEIKSMGLPVGIISNAADDKDVQQILAKSGVIQYLDMVITSAGSGYRKPHPEIFRLAAAQWENSLNQTIMVGNDIRADIHGGNQAGMFTIWSNQLVSPRLIDSFPDIKPDRIVQSLDEIPQVIRMLNK